MTALGKILSIFVFLFSILLCGLLMSEYVTRTNWKTEAETYRKKAQEAATSANSFKEEMEKQSKAYTAQIANLTRDKQTLATQLATLETNNQQQGTANQQLQTMIGKLTSANALNESNLKQAARQNEIQFEKIVLVEKEKDDAVRNQKTTEAISLAQKLETDGIRKQNERYQNQLIAMNEQLKDIRSGANRPGSVKVVPVPDGVRGTVDEVSGELITISLGADAEIRVGAELDVVRYGEKALLLGKVRIMEVLPKKSVGQFFSKDGPTAKGEALPKAGDTIMKINN